MKGRRDKRKDNRREVILVYLGGKKKQYKNFSFKSFQL